MSDEPSSDIYFVDSNVWLYMLLPGQDDEKADIAKETYTVHSITEPIQLNASRLRQRYLLSHWDSLIVSVALKSGAPKLYSEDMQNGLVVDNQLTIVNPFAHL